MRAPLLVPTSPGPHADDPLVHAAIHSGQADSADPTFRRQPDGRASEQNPLKIPREIASIAETRAAIGTQRFVRFITRIPPPANRTAKTSMPSRVHASLSHPARPANSAAFSITSRTPSKIPRTWSSSSAGFPTAHWAENCRMARTPANLRSAPLRRENPKPRTIHGLSSSARDGPTNCSASSARR